MSAFVKIEVTPLWRYWDFSTFQDSDRLPSWDLFGAHLDHIWRVLRGLYYCAKFVYDAVVLIT